MVVIFAIISIVAKSQVVSDSAFYVNSRPVIFDVNRASVSPADRAWLTDTLRVQLMNAEKGSFIMARSAASPEGPFANNQKLAEARYNAVCKVLAEVGYDINDIVFDFYEEDYEMLCVVMRLNGDPDAWFVADLVKDYSDDPVYMKQRLMAKDGGKLWRRILKNYFPDLRAVRFMVVPPAHPVDTVPAKEPEPAQPVEPAPVVEDHQPQPVPQVEPTPRPNEVPAMATHDIDELREPMLSVKTNLLYDAVFMPHLGYSPILNVEAEYYIHNSRYSVVGEYDFPWWSDDPKHHYFQAQNWTLELRRYFKKNAYRKGHYLSLYGQYNYWDFSFDAKRAWQGEGFGGGIGYGYVIPLGKQSRWKLELMVKAGFYTAKYDPYDAGDPYKGKYFYEWDDEPSKFVRRNYRFRYLGPTSVGVTLSYDLLFRRASDGKVTWRKLFKK